MADVSAAVEKHGGEGVAEGVAAATTAEISLGNGASDDGGEALEGKRVPPIRDPHGGGVVAGAGHDARSLSARPRPRSEFGFSECTACAAPLRRPAKRALRTCLIHGIVVLPMALRTPALQMIE